MPGAIRLLTEGGVGGGWTSISLCPTAGGIKVVSGNSVFVINERGQAASNPRIEQTLTDLEDGDTYQVSGQFANYYGCCGAPASVALSFAVLLDGAPILSLANPNSGAGLQPCPPAFSGSCGGSFTNFSVTFVATSSSHTVAFEAERGDDTDYAIDNIVVTEVDDD